MPEKLPTRGKRPATPTAPAHGVSPELAEIVLRWLRQRYGSRPIAHDVFFDLEYSLGGLERKYAGKGDDADATDPAPPSLAVRRLETGR